MKHFYERERQYRCLGLVICCLVYISGSKCGSWRRTVRGRNVHKDEVLAAHHVKDKNLAIANRSRVSCAHNSTSTSRAS